jgi:histone-lysine N-methyltransferase SETDB1
LDDIPIGEFICVYAGDLLTDKEANKDGTKFGDEYFIDLDLIEECTNTKEGYEIDIENVSLNSFGDSESSSDRSIDFSDSSSDHGENCHRKAFLRHTWI